MDRQVDVITQLRNLIFGAVVFRASGQFGFQYPVWGQQICQIADDILFVGVSEMHT